MSLDVRVEKVEERHIEKYAALSRTEYGVHAAVSQPEHLRWKYLENPAGPSVGFHLYNGEQLVGRMVAMPRDVIHRGTCYKAAYMADLLVERSFRGMTSLLHIFGGLKSLAGFNLILVTPNAAGAVVWEKFAKVPLQFDLDVAALPFRPARILQTTGKVKMGRMAFLADSPWGMVLRGLTSILPTVSGVTIDGEWPSAAELDRLQALYDPTDVAFGLRSPPYLEWRYRNSPIFKYDTWFLRRSHKLIGYVVTRRAQYEGHDCRFVVDAFCEPYLASNIQRETRFAVCRKGSSEGADMAIAIGNCTYGPLAQFSRFPFRRVPRKLLPRSTNLYAKWLTDPGFPLTPSRLFFSLGDCDMV